MTEATPRPWTLEGDSLNIHSGDPWTGDSVWIASTNGRVGEHGFPSDASAKANAALTVRAVNAHDALVEAVETALGIVDQGWLIDSEPTHYLRKKFAAALTLAKEAAP